VSTFGNIYFYDIDNTSSTNSYVIFINTTSQDATAIYGAFVH
jgi:hypothetical protein